MKENDQSAVRITIRPSESSDLDSVHEIEQISFREPWSRLAFRLTQWKNPQGFLVAVNDENRKVVGYVIAEVNNYLEPKSFHFKRRGHLLNIAVDPDFRNRGVGKALIEACVRYLQREGAKDVWLEVRASNLTARSLYLDMGFEDKERRFRYYLSEDAVVMTKKL